MSNFMTALTETYQAVPCPCGKLHKTGVQDVIAEKGALNKLPEAIRRLGGKKVFVLADENTYAAAGETVCRLLTQSQIPFSIYRFQEQHLEPDERAVGSAVMHFDHSCDLIVGVGSGVINDIGKILSTTTGKPYIIVATAPSMDGYASGSSSMALDGLKVSLKSRTPDIILGDVDILKQAPLHMLKSGLGDMLAKYVSICEWQLAHLLIGEYYCDTVAELVNTALDKCVRNAEGLLRREDEAVKAVFEGLVIGGIAMDYAGVSRPASGMEHYISHVWDMRGLALGTPVDTHGVQCAIGTLYTAKLYEWLREVTPDREKMLRHAAAFDVEDWYRQLSDFLGSGADAMIALDRKEQKYDCAKHAARTERIIGNWEKILQIIARIPTARQIEAILDLIDAPKSLTDIGLPAQILPMTIKAGKDIRDKYVLARLLWDLGILDEFANKLITE